MTIDAEEGFMVLRIRSDKEEVAIEFHIAPDNINEFLQEFLSKMGEAVLQRAKVIYEENQLV